MQRGGGEVTDCRSESKRSGDGQPVEQLATGCRNLVNRQRSFKDSPRDENHCQRNSVESRGHCVGNTKLDMQYIGAHRAKDADHYERRPVEEGLLTSGAHLEIEHDEENYATKQHHRDWVVGLYQVI